MSTPIHSARQLYGESDAATVAANNYAERLKSEVKTANLELEVERLRQELDALKAQHPPGKIVVPPVKGVDKDLWNAPMASLQKMADELSPGARERRTVFAHLAGALACANFNHRKYGVEGRYPRSLAAAAASERVESYAGHNVCALAVDKDGRVADFAFNHNALFGSPVEHAESRLMKQLLAEAARRGSDPPPPAPEGDEEPAHPGCAVARYEAGKASVKGYEIHTTLEPSEYAFGALSLGRADDVVYGMRDPTTPDLSAIVYNLSPKAMGVPRPSPSPASDLESDLAEAYADFARSQRNREGEPFFVAPDGTETYTASLSAFLCTDDAFAVFQEHAARFDAYVLAHGDFAPRDGALSNADALRAARDWLRRAALRGRATGAC